MHFQGSAFRATQFPQDPRPCERARSAHLGGLQKDGQFWACLGLRKLAKQEFLPCGKSQEGLFSRTVYGGAHVAGVVVFEHRKRVPKPTSTQVGFGCVSCERPACSPSQLFIVECHTETEDIESKNWGPLLETDTNCLAHPRECVFFGGALLENPRISDAADLFFLSLDVLRFSCGSKCWSMPTSLTMLLTGRNLGPQS